MVKYLIFILLFLWVPENYLNSKTSHQYVEFKAKKGDRIEKIFRSYLLPYSNWNLTNFIELNKEKTNQDFKLIIGLKYKLPILVLNEDNILKFMEQNYKDDSIKIINEKIKEYNSFAFSKGLKKNPKEIWVPTYLLKEKLTPTNNQLFSKVKSKEPKPTSIINKKLFAPYYSLQHKKTIRKTHLLGDYVFYLVSGHGGPDPGAIGYFDDKELHEDEYAYDITLRLAKYLEENGAKVYMITIDTLDGIRDDKFLQTSNREVFYGGVTIPLAQKERLEVCVKILNELYLKEKNNKRKKHISINIHLDSRSEEEKVDVFYYFQENNPTSKIIAETLQSTFAEKYKKYQPGRGYSGTVETRNLYMLKNSLPPTVYIELGNIKNRNNQYRFIDKSNRDALAKWLCIGLINFSKLGKKPSSNKRK